MTEPDPVHPSAQPAPPPVRVVAAFESTYAPLSDVDCLQTTGHEQRWRNDLDDLVAAGVLDLRYPVRWHRIEATPGHYDWRETDAVLAHMRDAGLRPVVDLVHHTSYPAWLTGGFGDPRFGPAYERFAEAVARRYPWLPGYTLFNEPFATLFLAGHAALWPPYDRGLPGLVRMLRAVLPSVLRAGAVWRRLLPEARHVWIDTGEHHGGGDAAGRREAEVANDRRFVALDLALGHDLDPARPFVRDLVAAGGADLLGMAEQVAGSTGTPLRVDVLGLDYYCHSEWWYEGGAGRAPAPRPVGFAAVAGQYAQRYSGPLGIPLMLSETNVRGLPTDQVSWLRHMLQEYDRAVAAGVPLDGFCWFPQVDSCDWDSLLARGGAGRRDPVGVLALEPDGGRRTTVMTDAWRAVARGARAADLPAYRWQSPVAGELTGYAPFVEDWPWVDPPAGELVPAVQVPLLAEPSRAEPSRAEPSRAEPSRAEPSRAEEPAVPVPDRSPDLVVLSHLRWAFVWQRPQHLVTRLTRARAGTGSRTWFVEEPVVTPEVDAPQLHQEQHGDVVRVQLRLPAGDGPAADRLDFTDPRAARYADLVAGLVGGGTTPDVWLYTPMALDIAEALEPGLVVYDVMDDLAAFALAPDGMRLRQRRALRTADVVLAGGRSLHAGVTPHRGDAHLFPSGVETDHYARSRSLRRPHDRPVAGFVGVLDERLDRDLVAGLAAALPDWDVHVVGPVVEFKLDPALLPQAPNIHYTGQQRYEDLPAVMAGFDVAIMPFALNEATRSISPTKTLEFLAAGLPVVSTPVPDVVADFGAVVHVASGVEEFAAACRSVLTDAVTERDRKMRGIEPRYEWDAIARSVHDIVEAARADRSHVRSQGRSASTGVTA